MCLVELWCGGDVLNGDNANGGVMVVVGDVMSGDVRVSGGGDVSGPYNTYFQKPQWRSAGFR